MIIMVYCYTILDHLLTPALQIAPPTDGNP
jgi:hypothetical protein